MEEFRFGQPSRCARGACALLCGLTLNHQVSAQRDHVIKDTAPISPDTSLYPHSRGSAAASGRCPPDSLPPPHPTVFGLRSGWALAAPLAWPTAPRGP